MPEQHPSEPDPTVRAIEEIRRTLGAEGIAGTPESAAARPQAPEDVVAMKKRLGIPIRLSEAPPDVRRSIVDEVNMLRIQAAEIMPSNDQGVDLPRIDSFFTRRGLSVQPVTILTPSNFRYYVDRLRELGYSSQSLDQLGQYNERKVTPLATYEPRLGRIIALRPEGKLTPLQIFELNYRIVHEKAHSTGGLPVEDMVYTEDDEKRTRNYFFERNGLTDLSTGEGIVGEEAYGELQAAKYVREELGRPNGFWNVTDTGLMVKHGDNDMVPIVYARPGEKGSKTDMNVSALPAYGLELLIEERPELEAALDAARTSEEGRQRVREIIDSVRPGLSEDLTHINAVTPAAFNASLRIIKRALGYA